MGLDYRFRTPDDLLAKLERERGRVFEGVKAEDDVGIADHFFNFCVTAHALRDWVSKSEEFRARGDDVHAVCNRFPVLKACRDIANSHKHFDFAKTRDTLAVFATTTKMVDVYQHVRTGEVHIAPPRDNADLCVLLGDGNAPGLWEFMSDTMKAWQQVLASLRLPRA